MMDYFGSWADTVLLYVVIVPIAAWVAYKILGDES